MLRGFTRTDYEAMPVDWRGELIEGELVMAPAPVPYHNYLVKRLLRRIEDHLGPEQEWRVLPAPTDVHVNDRNIFQPDLFVLPEGGARPTLDWEIPLPIWVIEVLSPRTARYDEEKKLPAFAEAGVREAWLIAPRARQIEIHDLRTGCGERVGMGGEAASISVPGFRLPLDDFFVD